MLSHLTLVLQGEQCERAVNKGATHYNWNSDSDKRKANVKQEQQRLEFQHKMYSSAPSGQSFHHLIELSSDPQGVQDITKYTL